MAQAAGVQHAALFYETDQDYVANVGAFVREGLAVDEAVLVAVGARQIGLLRDHLGADAGDVIFADMAELGRNPAHIIPEWQAFVEEYAVGPQGIRGVGEPVFPGRSPAELVECHRHEHLLNVAFADGPAWKLLCPYDTVNLPVAVVDEARRTHPLVSDGGPLDPSRHYHDVDTAGMPADSLSAPPADHHRMAITPDCLPDLRSFVAQHGRDAGLRAERVEDLVLAADELATNTIVHAGGDGWLRVWRDSATLLCQVEDFGHIDAPLADRTRPEFGQDGGRGLWLANHLCDLVQVRSSPSGTTVRLHTLLDP
jgi:anti-sigma regulatory factor (Ser/Thr protein kinase)